MSESQTKQVGPVHAWSLRFLLSPVVPFLDDATVSEVMINGAADVRVERRGRIEKTTAQFPSEESLMAAARNIAQYVGKRISSDTSRFDARLPDGSRVHVILPPASRQGVCMSIRKFFRTPISLDKLVELGSLTAEVREFLEICVCAERNMLVAGGTGSGKTTLLNVLSSLIPVDQRIIVLEDSSELQLQQEHVLYFETRPADRHGRGAVSIRDLFHSSLRMRPDRIVVGECRGGEAMDMVQAMTSGHGGSMTTLHADSPADALNRLETMALMSGVELPVLPLRSQIASAIEVVVQVGRLAGGARRVLAVAEVLGLDETGRYRVKEIYRFVPAGKSPDGTALGTLRRVGNSASFWETVRLKGLDGKAALTRDLFEGP